MKEWISKVSKNIPTYNCGNMSDRSFIMFFWFVVALFVISIMGVFLQYFGGLTFCLEISGGILLCLLMVGKGVVDISNQEEKPYIRMKDYSFLGLHDLSKEKHSESRDVISRDEEVDNIKSVLENLIFPQEMVKQALVLVGKSGCGKSTILTLFKQKYSGDYLIEDFSGNYMYFQTAMERKFGTNMNASLMRTIKHEKKKIVLILDQFERYFSQSDELKKEIKDILIFFGRKDIAIILSMREEYLSLFLSEFDVNDIKSNVQSKIKSKGILRNLVSILKDSSDNIRSKNIGTGLEKLSYKNQDCKNNTYMHLECPGFGERTIIEKVGVTIFYCENQNDSKVTMDNKQAVSTEMKDKCKIVFGMEEGKNFYNKYEKKTLIEQQIIFHMAEFEKKENNASQYELEDFYKQGDIVLLRKYFDRQIASCDDTFNALRILYLLSSARINQVSMNMVNLQEGLFECQFNANGSQILSKTIEKLQELQLIRQSIENSDIEYEIAHDFIATAFLNYSNTNISRHVKNALDLYMANYLEGKQEEQIKQRREFNKQTHKNIYYKTWSIVSMLLVVMIYLTERFVYNPFDTVWKWMDPYGEMFLFAPIINLISIWYLCRIYDKFVKYYRGKNELLCKILYIPIMLTAIGGVLFYPHVLAFDGVSLGIMGLNVAFLLYSGSYHDASKKELFSYGIKCSLMGFVYAGFHIGFVIWYEDGFSFVIMILETTVLWLLVVYAQLAHMTKDFLYARRMDVTCEKI